MHPQSPTRYLKKFSEKYQVSGLHPHKLRHTFASVAITSNADIASVSEALGHSDKAVTLRMYTHASKESISQAAQIFREAIKKAGQVNPVRPNISYRYGFLYGFLNFCHIRQNNKASQKVLNTEEKHPNQLSFRC